MLDLVSNEQINEELAATYRPNAIESGISSLPLSSLGDREFELLTYLLIKEEIQNGLFRDADDNSLCQGVGDRGRDCILYKNKAAVGVIQCKKYSSRLTRPLVVKELLKFIMYSIIDHEIMPNPSGFIYRIYSSNDLTEPAIKFIKEYATEILIEVSSKKIEKYCGELCEEYESFEPISKNLPLKEIEDRAKAISVDYSSAVDLSMRINKQERVQKSFFRVKMVIDLESNDHLIRKILDDYGLKMLTDEDLKSIKERIESIKSEERVCLGYVSTFGYQQEFFSYCHKNGTLSELYEAVTNVGAIFHRKYMDYTVSKIHEKILSEITDKLLITSKIHQISVGIANPYLFKRLMPILISKMTPDGLMEKMYPFAKQSKEEIIESVISQLLDSSRSIMNGDYSKLIGTTEEIEFKKKLYNHLHEGLVSIEKAEVRMREDLTTLMPTFDAIENEIKELIESDKTIIVRDMNFFDDKIAVKRMSETALKI